MTDKIIAIDFDGTLFETCFPAILRPRTEVIRAALQEQARGARLILWTCRVGEDLDAAVAACRRVGLTFDAVNENLPEHIALFDGDTRKVFAHEYWDDRAVQI